MQKFSTVLIVTVFILFQWSSLSAQDTLSGDWKGFIEIQGTELTIITHFQTTKKGFEGTIDIPQQGGQDIPLQEISLKQDSVHFEFIAGMGMAKFDGIIEKNQIEGIFTQGGQSFPFNLSRQKTSTATPPENTEEPTISNGKITLAGTLTTPENSPAPCVILLSGSGAQNRNSNIYGFQLFKRIADHLTQNGIAVFRYDDRGVGKSTGSFAQASRTDHLSDLQAIINHLKQHKKISPDKIGLIGHSQGGIIAGAAAVDHPDEIAFIVLMASPAQTQAETVIGQVKSTLREQGASDSLIDQQVQMQKTIFDTLRNSKNFDSLKIVLENQIAEKISALPENQRQSIQDPQKYAESQAEKQFQAIQQPSYFSFLDYDPAEDLQKMDVPVLAIYGEKDMQVPPEDNKPIAEKALKKSEVDYTIRVLNNANHLFQKAETGSVQEYVQLDNKFVDELLPTLTEWIQQQTQD